MNRSFLFIIALLCSYSVAGFADEQDNMFIEVESMVDTSVITIGDRINYSVIIKRAEDLTIARPAEGINLGMFEIKDYKFYDPEENDDYFVERFDFNISVYDTGKFVIPPYPVAYFTDDSLTNYQVIEAPAINIFVKSLLSAEGNELKDIKPPIEIPFDYWYWSSMAAVFLLLMLVAYFGYRLWKRKKEQGYLFAPPPPPKPAHEVALLAFNELFQSDLLDKQQFKQFFSRLTEILRLYLEGRYSVSAMEETTGEIMRDMKNHLDDSSLTEKLRQTLSSADLVKFAKHIPDEIEIKNAKQDAVQFVEETKIVWEPPEDGSDNGEAEPETIEKVLALPDNTVTNQTKTKI